MNRKNFCFYNKKIPESKPSRSGDIPSYPSECMRRALSESVRRIVQAGLLTPGSFGLQRLPDP
jgi:hypothetical protein